MDIVDISRAPQAYHDVAWIADICKLIMGVGWTTNYVGMIRKSLKDQTYAMAMLPLCCNFAWELTYAILYAFGSNLEKWVHFSGLLLNCGVMYTAVKNAHREWAHAPLVQRNLRLIFFFAVAGFASGHTALAMQIGPALGQALSAYACQLLLSVGGLCQLLSRGHSRGASYSLWFVGSLVLVPQDILRYTYWREDHEFMGSPLYIWFVTIFLILDGSYGICLWYVRRFEQETKAAEKLKK
ncbi:testicular acid phosphatase [Colletotrichum spaethianum]|uniref:Testicular acid phosphatase n=1 Tax=Colletotrichum spaethianum TaxID=700344 RepID=A0AA37P822_9PEZI|nr:testicular acid phosphatase [Colletotrichum spaethianum]GKT46894.1 testicular acid phosphatase [Colletotrichum spaethianum]